MNELVNSFMDSYVQQSSQDDKGDTPESYSWLKFRTPRDKRHFQNKQQIDKHLQQNYSRLTT